MNIERFHRSHLDEIDVHPRQRSIRTHLQPEYLTQLEAGSGYSLRIDGRLVLLGGVLDLYPDRSVGHVWTLMSAHGPRHMRQAHRVAERFLETSGKRVLVATTELSPPLACRWLRLLRFRFDHIERGFGPDGADHAVYVRVN